MPRGMTMLIRNVIVTLVLGLLLPRVALALPNFAQQTVNPAPPAISAPMGRN